MQGNKYTLLIAVLSAIKVGLDTMGVPVIDNQQINTLVDGVAILVNLVGVVINHLKPKQTTTTIGGK